MLKPRGGDPLEGTSTQACVHMGPQEKWKEVQRSAFSGVQWAWEHSCFKKTAVSKKTPFTNLSETLVVLLLISFI